MIKKLINKSRNAEVNSTVSRITTSFEHTTLSSDENLNRIISNLSSTNSELGTAIYRLVSVSHLDDKNDVREDAVRALGYFLKGNIYNPDDAIKAASVTLNDVFKRYGNSITSENYATESALIDSMLNDFAAADMQTAIAAVAGCANLIDSLQAAQSDFEATRINFEEEKANQTASANATKLKHEVIAITNDQLVNYMRSMVLVNEELYGSYGAIVNEIIEENNIVVKKRFTSQD